jgi:hypothetical protein
MAMKSSVNNQAANAAQQATAIVGQLSKQDEAVMKLILQKFPPSGPTPDPYPDLWDHIVQFGQQMAQPVRSQQIGAQPQPAENIQVANPNNAPAVEQKYRKISIKTPFSSPDCVNEIYLKKPDATATILDIKIAAAEMFGMPIESIILLFRGCPFKDDKPILELDLNVLNPQLFLSKNSSH